MLRLLKSKIFIDAIIVLCISAFFCLYNLSAPSFTPGDSARHSIVVQNMVRSGDYLHPKLFNEEPYYNKPPFKIWLVAAVVKFFGETHFSYRIVDRLIGIAFLLTVFIFAYKFFYSRAVAYFTFLTLIGIHILFYGHGIRDTVQDPMMLLLITWALICSWYFYEKAVSKEIATNADKRKLYRLGVGGGIFIGLATVTKNIVGFYPFVILFVFLVINRKLFIVLKKTPKQLLAIMAISCIFLPAYILSQWQYIDKLIADLFMTELYYRATEGFHYVRHNWFYWHMFFSKKQVVPPYLFLAAIAYVLFRIFKKKDDRALFILTWAAVPIILQNFANSKLRWYILPSVPAIAIIIGLFLGEIFASFNQNLQKYFQNKKRKLLALIFIQGAILSISIYQLSDHIAQVGDDFIDIKGKHLVEKISNEIVEYGLERQQRINFVYYHALGLVSNEVFYFNRQPIVAKYAFSLSEVKTLIEKKEADFVITNTEDYQEIVKLGIPRGFIKIPKDQNRPKAIILLVYHNEITPERFKPLTEFDN